MKHRNTLLFPALFLLIAFLGLYFRLALSVHVVGDKLIRSVGPVHLSTRNRSEHYEQHDAAIAILTTGQDGDLADLQINLNALGKALPNSTAPILIFHEGDVNQDAMAAIKEAASQGGYQGKVLFHVAVLNVPPGCCDFEPNWSSRTQFGYHNMIRFWIKDVWEHEAIVKGGFKTVMRLDTDSIINSTQPEGDELPSVPAGLVYRGNEMAVDFMPVIDQFDFFLNRTLESWHTPRNPKLVARFVDSLKNGAAPTIYNNFFVAKVEFFLRPNVRKLVDMACCTGPDFFVYRYRWGDAILHLFLLGMEASEDEYVIKPPVGYHHEWGR